MAAANARVQMRRCFSVPPPAPMLLPDEVGFVTAVFVDSVSAEQNPSLVGLTGNPTAYTRYFLVEEGHRLASAEKRRL